MKARVCLCFALLSLFPIIAKAQTSEEQIERSFHAGQVAMQDGQFERASEEFKKVLALDPSLVEAEVNLGLAYHSLVDYELAVRHLEKALGEKPNLIGPTVIVGMDYLKLGSPQKGIPFLQQALKLDPSNTTAREALASAYLRQANFRGAAEQFRQIASLDSDKSEAWFQLGHEYLDLAARLAYRGAHLYRDSAWGHRFLGDLIFQRSSWEDAIKEYQKALTIEPQEPGLHTSIGQAYLHSKKLEDAEREFHLEIQLDNSNDLAWLGLASAQLAGDQPTLALESVKRVWSISPEFLETQRDFPSIDLSLDSAKAFIAKAQDAPAGPAQHFLLASLCAAANHGACGDREWNAFQSAVAAWRSVAAPALAKGQDPCRSHFYSRCISLLKTRNQLTSSDRLLLGKAYFSLQKYDLAADSLAGVPGVTKENAEASYWLARAYQSLGIEAYEHLQESFPDSWRACQMRAEAAAVRGNLDDALKNFQAAVQLNPNEPELHEALGEFYLNQDADDVSAQGELERALALDPARPHALYLMGFMFVEKKENEKAMPYLQKALRLQPELDEANSLLGTVYVRLGRFADAAPALEKAAPSDHYGNVHYQLYLAYRKLGRSEQAQRELAVSQELRRNYLERSEALIMGSRPSKSEEQ